MEKLRCVMCRSNPLSLSPLQPCSLSIILSCPYTMRTIWATHLTPHLQFLCVLIYESVASRRLPKLSAHKKEFPVSVVFFYLIQGNSLCFISEVLSTEAVMFDMRIQYLISGLAVFPNLMISSVTLLLIIHCALMTLRKLYRTKNTWKPTITNKFELNKCFQSKCLLTSLDLTFFLFLFVNYTWHSP